MTNKQTISNMKKNMEKQNHENKVSKAKKEKKASYDIEDLIFSLDIGTRSVVGIVGYYEKECFKVVAAEIVEHKSRAMLDGQIHDIVKVAEVISEVRGKLEKSLGITLSKVAIAAAGRVLKTSQVKLEYDIDADSEISEEIVGGMEVDAVQSAQVKLDDELDDEKTVFYCVGYSVVNYFLNGYVISSLLGHKGKKMGVEVLATFLPRVVVDSLYTVMDKVGLKVHSLTLEPIAAISVTIPKELRLLNLVLVDIGAGTSDIAVTQSGSVVAYGMVPIAGDEITEKIAHSFLVDFNTAEKIKIDISSGTETIKFKDILGKNNEISNQEALGMLDSTIALLADSIAEKILEFNKKAPNAVFLIGGGSQIPGLTSKIADGLGIHEDRVAVRGRDVIHNIKTKLKKLSGPEAITPLGIAMMAYIQQGQDFLSVTLNGEKVKLLNSKRLSVADALILVGYNPDMLIARTGKSLKFSLNGKQMFLKGDYGVASEIYVNDSTASIDTQIKNGDVIIVHRANNGKNASRCVMDFVENPEGIIISLNGDALSLVPKAEINGEACDLYTDIKENDKLNIYETVTLGNLVQDFEINLDGRELLVNGEEGGFDYILQNGDYIEYHHVFADMESSSGKHNEKINAEAANIDDSSTIGSIENDKQGVGNSDRESYVIVNGERIVLKEYKAYIFVDIFSYINFDLSAPKGNIVLKLNGKSANFTDKIQCGDDIEIYWEKSKL
ncbi:cell division protein FtsA [Ruminiclostridium sufflavum DSM 19573]|uniref:Cell division protein FtsA n=1 Tax=Ruminiclostridium sufflavum DSM 19573 TaxID=1121337 RepID=A0A318XK48_9FIRM|nr:cell division protein FtsA [Ruminiclostridium sufflavum]PYG86838.1 cell division protein FtsA [Ruminiclostridium sufflavum DSM 19573]